MGCLLHPIVSGTGDFAGAQGVFQMVDTPSASRVDTHYIGNVTLKAGNARRSARASVLAGGTALSPRGRPAAPLPSASALASVPTAGEQ